ncbi:MAG: hypothetical protein Q4A48_03525 [Bacillota bacterium]|nr:hypothetical protein [Bacillota bacterium]
MKKLLYILLVIVLMAGLMSLSACDDNDNDSEDRDIETVAQAEYDTAMGAFSDARDFDTISSYLKKWAKSNKIEVEEDASSYLVLSLPATEGYEKAQSAVLQMPTGSGSSSVGCQVLSVLLTAAKTSRAHGDVKIIFTDNSEGDFSGAKKLDRKYLDTDNFINFMYENVPTVYNQGGASSYNRVTKNSYVSDSEHDKAFRVSISGLSGGYAGSTMAAETPNPLEVISGFLAAAKSDGYVFDLASFRGGVSAATIPKEASAVIVIPSSGVESLKKRFETSHKRFLKNYEETEPTAEYTLTQVNKPSGVFSDSAKDDIINLMYMLDTGSTQDKEGNTISLFNIGSVTTKNGNFEAEIALEDTAKENLADMQLSLETSCGLCHMKCDTRSNNEPWITYEESYLVSKLSDLCSTEPKSTIVQNENTIFKKRNKKLALVSFGVNISSAKRSVKVIDDFLASLISADDEEE